MKPVDKIEKQLQYMLKFNNCDNFTTRRAQFPNPKDNQELNDVPKNITSYLYSTISNIIYDIIPGNFQIVT